MKQLESFQLNLVGGGDAGEVDRNIGSGIAHAVHGLTSKEAQVGMMISPVGAVIGAIIHFSRNH